MVPLRLPDNYWAGYLDHPAAGRWLHAVRDLVSGLRDTLGLEAYLLALLDARFEMGLSGQPARLIGRCRMVSVDESFLDSTTARAKPQTWRPERPS